MPALAELLGQAAADRLDALKAALREREDQAAAEPVLPPPAAVFRDGGAR